MRTIPCIKDYLMPLEDVIHLKLIPSITGGRICSNDECVLLSLPTRFGGLGVLLFHENADTEFEKLEKTHIIIDGFNQRPISTILRKWN